MLKVIARQMDDQSVSDYLQLMQSQFQSPLVNEHFGGEHEFDQQNEKEEHRIGAIKSFSLGQIAAAPSIFRHCLSASHIS